MKRFIIASISLVLLSLAGIASAATIDFKIVPKQLRLGEKASATFTVFGDPQAPRPDFPTKDGWRIEFVGKTVVPNQAPPRIEYRFRLTPSRTGKTLFGPIRYNIGGLTKFSNTVVMEVVGADPLAEGGGADEKVKNFIMLQLSAAKSTVFVNESFEFTMDLCYRGLRISDNLSLPSQDAAGFKLSDYYPVSSIGLRKTINGDVYHVKRFRCIARPLTSGALAIRNTVRVNVEVPTNRRDRYGRSLVQIKPHDITSDPLKIKVKPLPLEGKPKNFSGAVGQFTFQAQAKPTELSVGDPISLVMAISGTGNMDAALTKGVLESEDFRTYDVILRNNNLNASETAGKRIFEQVVRPSREDITELPVLEFNYFDPNIGEYVRKTQGPFTLSIKPGTDLRKPGDIERNLPNGNGKIIKEEDLVYLKEHPAKWIKMGQASWHNSPGFLYAQLVPPVALLFALFVGNRRRSLNKNAAKARRLQAPKHARAAIRRAESALKADDAPAFYAAVWDALGAYFGNKFDLSPGEVSLEAVNQNMGEKRLSDEQKASIARLFARCEEQRFSGKEESERGDMEAILKQLIQVLKTCEKAL